MPPFDLIAFDADDTLWHNERLYTAAQARFAQLLAHYHEPEWVQARLYETETRNIAHFGYGIKGFALSMIETAVELTEGRVSGQDIRTLIDLAREMLSAEVELLPGVAETVAALASTYTLMVVTKGDLMDQESKVTRSGLGGYFRHIEVVSHKTPETYRRLLVKHGVASERFVMVGNSVKSDILPVLEIGGTAVYIPYALTWAHEAAEPPAEGTPGYRRIASIDEMPALIARLAQEM